MFDALTYENMDGILTIQLKRVHKLLAVRELSLELTDAARKFVVDNGFDPAFGARPLKRSITNYLVNPMSTAIIAGSFDPGDTIVVDVVDDALNFTTRAKEVPMVKSVGMNQAAPPPE